MNLKKYLTKLVGGGGIIWQNEFSNAPREIHGMETDFGPAKQPEANQRTDGTRHSVRRPLPSWQGIHASAYRRQYGHHASERLGLLGRKTNPTRCTARWLCTLPNTRYFVLDVPPEVTGVDATESRKSPKIRQSEHFHAIDQPRQINNFALRIFPMGYIIQENLTWHGGGGRC